MQIEYMDLQREELGMEGFMKKSQFEMEIDFRNWAASVDSEAFAEPSSHRSSNLAQETVSNF